jgi:phosphatidate cytidylyltransferase
MRWSDLRVRVVSAVVLAPLVLAVLWFGGAPFVAMLALAALVLSSEWVALCGVPRFAPAALAVPVSLLAAGSATVLGQPAAGLGLLAVGAGAALLLSRGAPHRHRLAAGIPYLGLPIVALLWLRADPVAGRANVLFIMLLVWSSDIGAYLAGRLIGGRRLAPRVSPGKTWSGAVGGLVAAALAGFAIGAVVAGVPEGGLPGTWREWLSAIGSPPEAAVAAAAVAGLLGIVGQVGDLLESALKRRFGVKDSGRLIPGHGGLLDRIDAVLAVAPVAACLALAAGRGVVLWL